MGSADRVVEEALHPYVQLPTGSKPIPEPKYRWKERLELPKVELSSESKRVKGRRFRDRCPKRMERCAKERSRLIDVGGEGVLT